MMSKLEDRWTEIMQSEEQKEQITKKQEHSLGEMEDTTQYTSLCRMAHGKERREAEGKIH